MCTCFFNRSHNPRPASFVPWTGTREAKISPPAIPSSGILQLEDDTARFARFLALGNVLS